MAGPPKIGKCPKLWNSTLLEIFIMNGPGIARSTFCYQILKSSVMWKSSCKVFHFCNGRNCNWKEELRIEMEWFFFFFVLSFFSFTVYKHVPRVCAEMLRKLRRVLLLLQIKIFCLLFILFFSVVFVAVQWKQIWTQKVENHFMQSCIRGRIRNTFYN